MMTRQCKTCKEIKLLDLFHKQFCKWTTKDGIKHKKKSFTNECKICNFKYHKNYHNKNRSRINETKRIIYWNDHEKTLKDKAAFRDSHRQAITEYQKNYYQENKETITIQNNEWVKNNPEKKKEASNKYSCKPEIKLKDSLKSKKAVKNLEDEYVRDIIIKRTSLIRVDIPDELVELKRAQLKVIRILRDG